MSIEVVFNKSCGSVVSAAGPMCYVAVEISFRLFLFLGGSEWGSCCFSRLYQVRC